MKIGTCILAAALLTGLATTTAARADGDPVKGETVFKRCFACHRIGPGAKNLVGPELNGVVGRKAGAVEGFSYSSAMKDSGLTFDEATLAEYVKAPRTVVPGTRMVFAGIKKDTEIANLIAYLKSFDAAGNPVAPR